jgi:DNA-binding transcriptional LysR family regulator
MDTGFLESFVIVAEKGSMAEAARRLNLTPAAVAQQLGALEQEIGNALVVARRAHRAPHPGWFRGAGASP